jgi:hypothetical protein
VYSEEKAGYQLLFNTDLDFIIDLCQVLFLEKEGMYIAC